MGLRLLLQSKLIWCRISAFDLHIEILPWSIHKVKIKAMNICLLIIKIVTVQTLLFSLNRKLHMCCRRAYLYLTLAFSRSTCPLEWCVIKSFDLLVKLTSSFLSKNCFKIWPWSNLGKVIISENSNYITVHGFLMYAGLHYVVFRMTAWVVSKL